MKNILSLFFFIFITIVINAQSNSKSSLTSVTFKYDKIQLAQTDQNYYPIERTTIVKAAKGTITFNKSLIIINNESYRITKSRKVENRYEVAASKGDKYYVFSIVTADQKNTVMMISFSDLQITLYNITSGFTLNIPFLNNLNL